MGKNFIGPDELSVVSGKLGIRASKNLPEMPFSKELLKKVKNDAVLILGVPATINGMRDHFGLDSKRKPCFYNQDWYLKERFANNKLKLGWYLISKHVDPKSRAKRPQDIKQTKKSSFPSAALCTFTFFAYYFHTKGEVLWPHDFIWCSDKDKNGDQIYVGRYTDPLGISKNGFNIHRYLQIRSWHGLAPEIK